MINRKLNTSTRIILFAAFILFCSLPQALAEGKKSAVVLTTTNLNVDYEILGVISYRSSETIPDKINNELKRQAEDMGADYVIGITYYSGFGYLYGSGTAVKLIKKDKGK